MDPKPGRENFGRGTITKERTLQLLISGDGWIEDNDHDEHVVVSGIVDGLLDRDFFDELQKSGVLKQVKGPGQKKSWVYNPGPAVI